MLTATVAGYHLAVDLTPDPQQSSLGLATFTRDGCSPFLGWPQALPAHLAAPFDPEAPPLTWGPAYKEADGSWVSLAGIPTDAVEVVILEQSHQADNFHLHVEYRIGGGPTLGEEYTLAPHSLTYATQMQWLVGGFRFNLPLCYTKVSLAPTLQLQGGDLTWSQSGQCLRVHTSHAPPNWEIFPGAFAHGENLLRHVGLQSRSVIRYEVQFLIDNTK
jgi:hypothetical protein